ncbi:hypothetical protein GO730_21085 [Spirosoma sp. HMF3257]|uniref:hypothetical protein n=1 Tax=Spirosoma telluris TaxID=2183553 RepID=UPI0012F96241|nr:hypothetical protein [Spirosoma telluris]
MRTSSEAAKSAVRDKYVPESTVNALILEMDDLRREIKRLKKSNYKKEVIIAYLEGK